MFFPDLDKINENLLNKRVYSSSSSSNLESNNSWFGLAIFYIVILCSILPIGLLIDVLKSKYKKFCNIIKKIQHGRKFIAKKIIEEDKNSGLTEWGTDIEVVKYTEPSEEYFGTKNKTNQHHQIYGEKNFLGENNNKHQIIPISDATYTSLNELASKKVPQQPVLDKNYSGTLY